MDELDAARVTPIEYDELEEKLARGALVVIDARLPGEYEQGHIPGSLAISWYEIAASASRIIPTQDSEVAVYCTSATCIASALVADELVKLGYRRVRRYFGGLQDWLDRGRSLERPYVSDPEEEEEGKASPDDCTTGER